MSHYIRTIHTSFTSTPSSSSSFVSIMNKSYPPGLTPDTHTWRTSSPSGSTSYNSHHNPKRRSSIPLLRAPTPRRPPPPPPQPRQLIKFDPFADENSPFDILPPSKSSHTNNPVIYHTPSSPYTIHIPPAAMPVTSTPEQRSFDREARAKLVAGILLNRAQVGKPPRRRYMGEQKTYRKSSLSSVVCVEA